MPVETIKVPEDRIAVVIGKKGKTKKMIEELSKCKLTIDSKNHEVTVECEDAIAFLRTLNVVKAIARGFNPEKAILLLDEDYTLEIIDIKEYTGKRTKKALWTKKARLIGTKGKIRKMIEQKTNCFISIYGKTVSIIGRYEDLQIAREAILMILEGAHFSTVERFLNKSISVRKFAYMQ